MICSEFSSFCFFLFFFFFHFRNYSVTAIPATQKYVQYVRLLRKMPFLRYSKGFLASKTSSNNNNTKNAFQPSKTTHPVSQVFRRQIMQNVGQMEIAPIHLNLQHTLPKSSSTHRSDS